MGKSSGGGGQNTVVNNSQPPQQFLDAYSALVNRANQVAGQPLQQYSGNITAPFSDAQNQGFGITGNAANALAQFGNPAQQYIDAAVGSYGQATQPLWSGVQQFSPSAVGQYQSPYTQDVVNATQNQFNQSNQIQSDQLAGNAITKGAFGGDREAVAQGVLAGQQQLNQAPVIAGLYDKGYSQALNEFNTQQTSQLGANQANAWLNSQAASGLAGLGQQQFNTNLGGINAALQGAGALQGIGGIQQAQEQQLLNTPYQQFIQQQAYPYQTTGWLANITSGLGGSSGGSSATSYPSPSMLGQVLGGGAALTGILGQTGAFGNNGYLSGLFSGGAGAGAAADGWGQAGAAANNISTGVGNVPYRRGGIVIPFPHRARGGGIVSANDDYHDAPIQRRAVGGSFGMSPDELRSFYDSRPSTPSGGSGGITSFLPTPAPSTGAPPQTGTIASPGYGGTSTQSAHPGGHNVNTPGGVQALLQSAGLTQAQIAALSPAQIDAVNGLIANNNNGGDNGQGDPDSGTTDSLGGLANAAMTGVGMMSPVGALGFGVNAVQGINAPNMGLMAGLAALFGEGPNAALTNATPGVDTNGVAYAAPSGHDLAAAVDTAGRGALNGAIGGLGSLSDVADTLGYNAGLANPGDSEGYSNPGGHGIGGYGADAAAAAAAASAAAAAAATAGAAPDTGATGDDDGDDGDGDGGDGGDYRGGRVRRRHADGGIIDDGRDPPPQPSVFDPPRIDTRRMRKGLKSEPPPQPKPPVRYGEAAGAVFRANGGIVGYDEGGDVNSDYDPRTGYGAEPLATQVDILRRAGDPARYRNDPLFSSKLVQDEIVRRSGEAIPAAAAAAPSPQRVGPRYTARRPPPGPGSMPQDPDDPTASTEPFVSYRSPLRGNAVPPPRQPTFGMPQETYRDPIGSPDDDYGSPSDAIEPVPPPMAPRPSAGGITTDPEPDLPGPMPVRPDQPRAPVGIAPTPRYTSDYAPREVSNRSAEARNRAIWQALTEAGGATLASRSPHAGVAIGQGIQAGSKTFGAGMTEADRMAEREEEQRDTGNYHKASLNMQAQRFSDAAEHAKATLQAQTKHYADTAEQQAAHTEEIRRHNLATEGKGYWEPVRALTNEDGSPKTDKDGTPLGVWIDRTTNKTETRPLADPTIKGKGGATAALAAQLVAQGAATDTAEALRIIRDPTGKNAETLNTARERLALTAARSDPEYQSDSKATLDRHRAYYGLGAGAGGGPKVGTIKGGYKFLGGDPADQDSWEKQ